MKHKTRLLFAIYFILLFLFFESCGASVETREEIVQNHVADLLAHYEGKAGLTLAILASEETQKGTNDDDYNELYNNVFQFVFRYKKFKIVERDMINKLLSEMSFQKTGLVEQDLVSKIGKLSGAQLVLVIRKRLNNVDLRIVQVQDGVVLAFTSFHWKKAKSKSSESESSGSDETAVNPPGQEKDNSGTGTSGNVSGSDNANGKYSTLLKTINCPGDQSSYGNFYDYGHYPATQWCGTTAPEGYWVYFYPKWYIWKKMK